MDLWNEYEGRSIDGLFPLERLIRPEGRSAFFTTSSSGTSTVIRLIESHFDEEEILARWTGVSDLHQPNLVTLTRFGQTMMDETSLVYVVMEPTEADLSQILCERPLTLAETRQVAASLIPALQALHARGFIHEHILAANVLAVGEVVKLRSDCIREAPADSQGTALRARDVQDLATLLLQCLTQQRSHTSSPTGPPLPAPFRELIHNAISGTWTLVQMAAALQVTAPKFPSLAPELPRAPHATPVQELHRRPATPAAEVPVPLAAPYASPRSDKDRIRVPVRQSSEPPRHRIVLSILALLALLLVAAFAFMHRAGRPAAPAATVTSPDGNIAPADQVVAPASAANAKAANTAIISAPHQQSVASTPRNEWRVVAFTYNRQDQATAKARLLEQRYASLHPTVFTPTGHSPYLVTLGGLLSRDAAFALKNKLRGAGLPRDLYAQNYSSKSR